MNYYYLVSSLEELQQNDSKKQQPLSELLEEFFSQLSPEDAVLLRLLSMETDNKNLITYLADREAELNPAGWLSSEDFYRIIEQYEEHGAIYDNIKETPTIPYFGEFYSLYNSEAAKGLLPEDMIASAYYQYGTNVKNKFVSEWFEFNLNVNNILVALICRQYDFDVKAAVIGNNEIAEQLRVSNSRDFGVRELFEDYDSIVKIAEEKNILERERKLDQLRWAWLENNIFFHYFSIEKVLSHYLKLGMLNRWGELSFKQGKKVLDEMLSEMVKPVSHYEE